jgi:hypothetical protein
MVIQKSCGRSPRVPRGARRRLNGPRTPQVTPSPSNNRASGQGRLSGPLLSETKYHREYSSIVTAELQSSVEHTTRNRSAPCVSIPVFPFDAKVEKILEKDYKGLQYAEIWQLWRLDSRVGKN